MKHRAYSLGKLNRIEIRVMDSRSKTGISKLVINKNLYIKLLENGARGFAMSYDEKGKGQIVYRKGLGIIKNSVLDYISQVMRIRNATINAHRKQRLNK